MDRVEEQHILKLAILGDSEAFARLYRAHVQSIFRYLYYRLNDTHLAEDFTADVFTHALRDLPTYQDIGKPFIAWLYRIAHARVVDYYRRIERRGLESELDESLHSSRMDEAVDTSIIRKQIAQILRHAIANLSPAQQQVVILRFIESKNLEETAHIMNKNVNAIKALQHRALRTLAHTLQMAGFDGDEFLAGLA